MARRATLARRLALLISAGLAAVWLVAVAAMAVILRQEQTELYDQLLVVSAEALLPVLGSTDSHPSPPPTRAPTRHADEALIWRVIDRDGGVRAASALADPGRFPASPQPERIQRTASHMVYTTAYADSGLAVQFADPLAERREAWRESFLAFLMPMLALLPLGYLAGGWITRLALRPLETLRADMATRDSRALAPMTPQAYPAELAEIVATLNGFMARLSQALEGERAFATNAAHELRTPVAVALAQVQRLAQETPDPAAQARVAAVETALRRMARLVARLLQLARAESGIGPGETQVDAAALLPLVIRDLGAASAGRLDLQLAKGPVWTSMDADALAIVAGNLIENALQHSPPGSRVSVALDAFGTLAVGNPGPVLPPARLQDIARRHARRDGGGFGLGLHIVSQIARQSGTSLELASPLPDGRDGFQARISLPQADR